MNERHGFISYIGSLWYGHRIKRVRTWSRLPAWDTGRDHRGKQGFSKPVFKHGLCEHCEYGQASMPSLGKRWWSIQTARLTELSSPSSKQGRWGKCRKWDLTSGKMRPLRVSHRLKSHRKQNQAGRPRWDGLERPSCFSLCISSCLANTFQPVIFFICPEVDRWFYVALFLLCWFQGNTKWFSVLKQVACESILEFRNILSWMLFMTPLSSWALLPVIWWRAAGVSCQQWGEARMWYWWKCIPLQAQGRQYALWGSLKTQRTPAWSALYCKHLESNCRPCPVLLLWWPQMEVPFSEAAESRFWQNY